MSFSMKSIKKGGENKPPIMVIHGPPGIGKTTFASMAPNPIFIRSEDGMGILKSDTFPLCRTFSDLIDQLGALINEDHEYKTVIFDSMTAIEPLIAAQVALDHGIDNIASIGYGKGYIYAMDYWAMLFDGISKIRDDKAVAPVLIAHSMIKRYDSPDVEPYDRYLIELHEKAFLLTYERSDIIAFANWQTHVVKAEVGFNKSVSRGISTGERQLHLIERPAYVAKNRYGMQATIQFSWEAFASEFIGATKDAFALKPTSTKTS